MTNRLLQTVLRRAEALTADATPDAELVRRFAESRDEAAFAALVRRHGPMVWAVGRQMLPNPADADDAFQAVFLALMQSAAKLKRVHSLGGWLHGVTVRVCLRARRTAVRRRQREQATAKPEVNRPEPQWADLHAAVHEEVEQLPDSLRTAFVLCDLQGVRQPDAATRLGWKIGTLSGRLTRARQLLLKKLTARGLAPVLAVGTVSIGGTATGGGMPAALSRGVFALLRNGGNTTGVSATVLELARGATEGMMSKVKLFVGSVMAATGLAVAAGSGWLPTADAQRPTDTAPKPASAPAGSPDADPRLRDANVIPAGDPTADPTPPPKPRTGTPPAATAPASSQRYEHKAVSVPKSQMEFMSLLRKEEQDGWEFVGQVSVPAGDSPYTQLVFKRPKAVTRETYLSGAWGNVPYGETVSPATPIYAPSPAADPYRGPSKTGTLPASAAPSTDVTPRTPPTATTPSPRASKSTQETPDYQVISLRYADAKDLEPMLARLFTGGTFAANGRDTLVIGAADAKTVAAAMKLIDEMERQAADRLKEREAELKRRPRPEANPSK